MLGAILAMGVPGYRGAAKSIANFFIRLFHGKNLELAPALTAYIVSIPVFGDITTILTSNIANVLSKRKRHFHGVRWRLLYAGGPEPDSMRWCPYAWHFGRQHLCWGGSGMTISWGIVIPLGCADANVGGPEKVDRKRVD